MYRRRRVVAPHFKVPPPFNPATGEQAPIGRLPPSKTRLAMFQVIEEDTHENYLVCRGFDPEVGKFFHELSVAKAYSERGKYNHTVGQVFPAAKFKTKLGDNSGMASVSVGQPADLDEEVVFVTDDEDRKLLWTEIAGGTNAIVFELKNSIAPSNPSGEAWPRYWDEDAQDYVADYEEETIWVWDPTAKRRSVGRDDMAEDKPGAYGWATAGTGEIYRIGDIQERARRCKAQLTANLAMGDGTGTVAVDNVVPFDGGQSPVTSSSKTLTVLNRPRSNALDNAPCDIVWDDKAAQWVLEWVYQRAMRIRGTLGGALTATTASQTINDPVATDNGQVPAGAVAGFNTRTTKGFAGPDGGVCRAEWDESTSRYEFYDVECP